MQDKEQSLEPKPTPSPEKRALPPLPKPPPIRILREGEEKPRKERSSTRVD